jgi:hypothetical protein
MTGQYRFLQVKAGRTHFARAWVEALPFRSCTEIENALPEVTEPGSGEVNRHSEPSWVEAALEGMTAAGAAACSRHEPGGGFRLRLIRLLGTVVDTTPDVVRCAAALAAWEAMNLAAPPEPQFDGREWTLAFPAPASHGVAGISS